MIGNYKHHINYGAARQTGKREVTIKKNRVSSNVGLLTCKLSLWSLHVIIYIIIPHILITINRLIWLDNG